MCSSDLPDKREARRIEKLEGDKQNLRWRAAEMVKDGHSYRYTGKTLGRSHQFVKIWAKRLLEKIRVKGIFVYKFRKDARKRVVTRRPGPRPGLDHVCDKIMKIVVSVRKKKILFWELNLERINFTKLFYSTYSTNRVKTEKIDSLKQMFEISKLK